MHYMKEPYAYIKERINDMDGDAKRLRREIMRLTERAETLEYQASSLRDAVEKQKRADEESKLEFGEPKSD